jgi:hypothetical protein
VACRLSAVRGFATYLQQKAHNRTATALREPGERGFATLNAWRIFIKIRCYPQRVGALAQAVPILELGRNIRLETTHGADPIRRTGSMSWCHATLLSVPLLCAVAS